MYDTYTKDIIQLVSEPKRKPDTLYNPISIICDLPRDKQIKEDLQFGLRSIIETESIENTPQSLLLNRNSTIYLGVDKTQGAFIFTLAPDRNGKCRGILYTKNRITKFSREKEVISSVQPISKIKDLVKLVNPEFNNFIIKPAENQSDLRRKLEENSTEFGLVICKDGQVVDYDIFSNGVGNTVYHKFLHLIGGTFKWIYKLLKRLGCFISNLTG